MITGTNSYSHHAVKKCSLRLLLVRNDFFFRDSITNFQCEKELNSKVGGTVLVITYSKYENMKCQVYRTNTFLLSY